MDTSRTNCVLLLIAFIPAIRSNQCDLEQAFCTGQNQLFKGDFNGDGKTDLLCHRPIDGYKWIAFANENGEFTGTSWEDAMGWCFHKTAEIHIGDYNGDGRSDMLCHDTKSGDKFVEYASGDGTFSPRSSWSADLGWCLHHGSRLHIGDYNGDGRDDMLCHDTSGSMWVSYASSTGSFSGNSWKKLNWWCSHSGSRLFVGDFNGDSTSDVLCHDDRGSMWIMDGGELNNGHRWSLHEVGWCRGSSEELHIADFNGDGKDDMLCHDSRNGKKYVALASCENDFRDFPSWEGDLNFCENSNEEFHLGDFNGDQKTDMLCHDKSCGKKNILYNEFQCECTQMFP